MARNENTDPTTQENTMDLTIVAIFAHIKARLTQAHTTLNRGPHVFLAQAAADVVRNGEYLVGRALNLDLCETNAHLDPDAYKAAQLSYKSSLNFFHMAEERYMALLTADGDRIWHRI